MIADGFSLVLSTENEASVAVLVFILEDIGHFRQGEDWSSWEWLLSIYFLLRVFLVLKIHKAIEQHFVATCTFNECFAFVTDHKKEVNDLVPS